MWHAYWVPVGVRHNSCMLNSRAAMQGASVPACMYWVAHLHQALAKGGITVASASSPCTDSLHAGCVGVSAGVSAASAIVGEMMIVIVCVN